MDIVEVMAAVTGLDGEAGVGEVDRKFDINSTQNLDTSSKFSFKSVSKVDNASLGLLGLLGLLSLLSVGFSQIKSISQTVFFIYC